VKKGAIAAEAIGLIPAAGYSRRISPIPCSKEIYPVGFSRNSSGDDRPKAVCLYLIESMKRAGVTKIILVIRKGKLDIPVYLGDGRRFGVELAYRVMDDSPSPSHALDHAYPFVKDRVVASGFPDIMFQPDDAFGRLMACLQRTQADVVFGVYPIKKSVKDDRVVLSGTGRVRNFAVSTSGAKDPHTWLMAVWGPVFTEFLHQFLQKQGSTSSTATAELTVGHALEPAFRAGLHMQGVLFERGRFLDIGVSHNLRKAVQQLSRKDHLVM
jgi:glucose-1-phosphate thymidylyltransferase